MKNCDYTRINLEEKISQSTYILKNQQLQSSITLGVLTNDFRFHLIQSIIKQTL